MNLKPLFDRVVLKQIKKQNQTKSGLFIAESSGDEPLIGEIIACGDGESFEGKKLEMYVKPGDKVLYNKFGAIEFKSDGETLAVLRQSDIFGILEDYDG